jgi:anti-sigma factor RsiW
MSTIENTPPLACRELVELVTDYLDDVLPPGWRDGVASHLAECDGCTEYVRQVRTTIAALGGLRQAAELDATHRSE